MDTIEPPIFTCDAVLSEACFLLQDINGGPDAVMELVSRGIVKSDFRVMGEVDAVRTLMRKFATVPMSLADACVVRMTELEQKSIVVTLDSDFKVYRRNKRQVVPTLMPE
jgi:predicted nucleic acid-binding protein